MARIAGVDLPRQKYIHIALTYIYGIGHPRAGQILDAAKVEATKKVQDLSEEEVNRIRTVIEEQGMVEGDLRKEVSLNIKRLIEIGSYRGFRHRRNLPVRGQRTHTNARTRKGPRKGTVAQKKKATAKT
ncbi:MAG: 30S ribosomal protein S13 [Candidatus Sulfotelmatobacter sp.]|jgi:small subunit ribosomal protein S13